MVKQWSGPGWRMIARAALTCALAAASCSEADMGGVGGAAGGAGGMAGIADAGGSGGTGGMAGSGGNGGAAGTGDAGGAAGSGGTGGTGGYDGAISYTQTRPAFTAQRTINVASAPELLAAISNLQPGDLVRATAPFTVNGETILSKRLSDWAVIDLSGYAVKFVYSGGQDLPAVWLHNASHVRIYGGEATTVNTGGGCILAHGSQYITWWGFTAHDCGGSGFSALTVNAPVDHLDVQGEIWKVGQNLNWDPHPEKGTGVHCAGEFADADSGDAFTNNRLAYYCHDIPAGNAFAFGDSSPAVMTGNTLYLKAVNLTFVAVSQTAGNGICLWGDTNQMGLDVKYVEVENAQGYGLFDHGLYSGQNLHGVTVEYGRASNTNKNQRYAGQNPWMTDKGVVYRNVLPAP